MPHLCADGHRDYMENADIIGIDNYGHGTNVTKAIGTQIGDGDYCFLIYKVLDMTSFEKDMYPSIPTNDLPRRYAAAILRATDQGAKIINISAGGDNADEDERQAIIYATIRGVKFFVAAGNNHHDLDKKCDYFSACYKIKGVEIVGATDPDDKNKHAIYSNYGDTVTIWQDGIFEDQHGTSQATAKACGLYVKILLKGNFYDFQKRNIAGRRV